MALRASCSASPMIAALAVAEHCVGGGGADGEVRAEVEIAVPGLRVVGRCEKPPLFRMSSKDERGGRD